MKISLYICIFILLSPAVSNADRASSANKRGIKAYNEQKYDESSEHFTEAVTENPDSPELRFNLGTALSEQNETEAALRELNTAVQGFNKSNQQAAAHFNAGNTLFLSGNLESAIEEYVKAVKLDQSSEDIRNNLEITVRKLQQQQKQQQEQQQDNGKQKEDSDKQNGQQKKDTQEKQEEEEQKSDEKKNRTDSSEENEKQDQEQQKSQQMDNEQKPMTPQEAQRILDAINDEEKKALSLRKQKMQKEMRLGNDW
ncbi:tetratricopeptide repeat protein [Candidatus Latescibacterota bacterium]